MFLEKPSSGTLIIERLESQIISCFGSNKTKGPMQDSQTRCDVYRDMMTNNIQTDCN